MAVLINIIITISILIIMLIRKDTVSVISFIILLCVVLVIDYHGYLRGSKAIFFYDKTQIEKDLREVQKLEVKKKLKELQENAK